MNEVIAFVKKAIDENLVVKTNVGSKYCDIITANDGYCVYFKVIDNILSIAVPEKGSYIDSITISDKEAAQFQLLSAEISEYNVEKVVNTIYSFLNTPDKEISIDDLDEE